MKLKELRTKANKSQREMAEYLHMSQTGYNGYEIGKSEPNIDTLIRLAQYFHTTIDNLVGNETPYLLDKSQFTGRQLDLIEKIRIMSEEECMLLDAYAEGLIKGQQERQEKFDNFKRRV